MRLRRKRPTHTHTTDVMYVLFLTSHRPFLLGGPSIRHTAVTRFVEDAQHFVSLSPRPPLKGNALNSNAIDSGRRHGDTRHDNDDGGGGGASVGE